MQREASTITSFFADSKIEAYGAREMTWWLSVQSVLPEVLSLIRRYHMMAYKKKKSRSIVHACNVSPWKNEAGG